MNEKNLNNILQKILPVYFIALFVKIAVGTLSQVNFHEGFNIGDWLINYEGGFTRRGFLGEILYLLTFVTHVPIQYFLVIFQSLFFFIYFLFSYKLLKMNNDILKYSLLIFSPFLFTYAVNSMNGGYRKEIVYFSILSYFVYSYLTYDQEKFRRSTYFILFLYPLVILTDEVGVVILPIIFSLFLNRFPEIKLRSKKFLIFFGAFSINVLTFILVIIHHRISRSETYMIYDSILNSGYHPGKIPDAIYFLNGTLTKNIIDVVNAVKYNSYLSIYALAFSLSMISFIPLWKEIRFIIRNKKLLFGLLSSTIIVIALMCIAVDWGRWIYIFLVILFFLVIIADSDSEKKIKIEK